MEENKVIGFNFFRTYYELIRYLSDEDRLKMYDTILDYVFEDIEPDLKGLLNGIWMNISIPINTSKMKSKAGQNKNKKETNQNQTKIKPKSNENQKEIKKETNNIPLPLPNKNIIKEVINYLNTKTNSNYKYSSKLNQSKINARLNEGYSLDDFIVVIDKKYDEWVGTEFERYLCPETLFGAKFEKYLNQTDIKKNKRDYKPMDDETVEFIENYDWLDSNGE